MGSPGAFIHSGTFGGRLPEPGAVCSARAGLPARPPASVPPNSAAPSPSIWRRDSECFVSFASAVVDLVAISTFAPGRHGLSAGYAADRHLGTFPVISQRRLVPNRARIGKPVSQNLLTA